MSAPWREATRIGLRWWLLSRVIITTLAVVGDQARAELLRRHLIEPTPIPAGRPPFEILNIFDAAYYREIAHQGYFAPGGDPLVRAFFPGYPLTVRAVSQVVGLELALWLVPFLAAVVACVMIARLAQELRCPPGWTTALFAFAPYAVFGAAGYSESLFAALSFSAWYLGLRGRWMWCGVVAGLATFTRPNGMFLVLGLLIMFLLQERRPWRGWLWLPLSGLGAASFLGYLWWRTGDPRAWTHVQEVGWGRRTSMPWSTLRRTLRELAPGHHLDGQIQYGLDLVFLLIVLGLLWALYQRRWWAQFGYVAAGVLALATSVTLQSFGRNTLTLFPLYLVVGAYLAAAPTWRRAVVLVPWLGLFVFNVFSLSVGGWTD